MRLPLKVLLSLICSAILLVVSDDILAQKSESELNARQWVQQLGAESWSDREAAAKKLVASGDEITAALRRGITHPDAEVRRQVGRLLVERIKNELILGIAMLKAEDFKDQILPAELPSWDRFRKQIGGDKSARKLFAQMLTDEPALMFACQAGGKVASNAANARVRQVIANLYNRTSSERRQPSLGTVAALVFASAHPDAIDEDGLLTGRWMSTIIRQTVFTSTLTAKARSTATRKLVGVWIESESDQAGILDRLNIAVMYQIMPQGLQLTLRTIAAPKNVDVRQLTLAFEGVARLGGKDYSRLLARFLDDKNALGGVRIVNKKKIQMQVRDVALAWLLYSTKQDPGKYNLPNAKRWFDMLKTSPNRVLNNYYLQFRPEAARDAAFKKWHAWVKDNPLPKLPADAIVEPVKRPAAKPDNVKGKNFEPNENPQNAVHIMPLADRARLRRLRRAQQMLAENPDRLEAISLISQLLMEDRDWIFRTEGETPVYRTIRSAAEDIIGDFSPRQLELYEQQFGDLAQADLQHAINDGSAALEKIAAKYFFTKAGGEAVYRIAIKHIDHRQFFQAALWLSRLTRSPPAAKRYQPRLSLMLAFCWHEAGVTERAADALATLRDAGYEDVQFLGKTQTLPEREKTTEWLNAVFADHVSGPTSVDDSLPALAIDLPAPAIDSRPEYRTRIETKYDAVITNAMKAIDGMHRQFGVAAIPQFKPVVVGDTVIIRTLFELRCVSLSTSKTLWKSSVLSGLDTLLPRSGGSGRAASNVTLARSLRKWLWDRSVASSLVGDGRRVFAVEDVSPPDGGYLPVMEILPDGTPTLREGSGKTHNRLTAWDVKTGKVLWECGGPVNTQPAKKGTATNQANTDSEATKSDLAVPVARSLAGVRFIGAPNPLGDQLCVVGQVEDQIELFLLDSATGQLVSRSTLHMHDEMPVGFMRGFPFGKMNVSPINATGSAPVLDNDAVFVYVGSNRYVAFDLAAMRILWAYQEKRHEQPRSANIRNFKLVQQFAANQMTRPDRWTSAKPTIIGSRVLITPPVTDLLVCLDRDNGSVLWDVPREDGLFIAGIVDGVAVVVGRSGVRGIRVKDGKPAWTPARIEMPDGIQPAGQGVLIPMLSASSKQKTARLHLPQANGNVAVLDIERGRWSTAQWDAAGRAGNLQFGKKTIVSQDSAGITIFDRISNRRELVLAKLESNPNDVAALTTAVELALNDSEWSEAIAFATRAVKAGGGQKVEMTLADSHATSLRHLSSDSARAAVSIQAAIDSIELLASSEPKLRLRRAIATAQRENKDPIGALQSWLKIIQSQPGTSSDLRALSFVWRVREDRQIQAELKELFQSDLSDSKRAAMTEHLLAFRSENSPDVFIRFFGFHELANQSRLTKAAEHSKKKQWLIAQQLLMSVAKTGSSDEQVTATRLIVELLLERGEIGPAQFYVERLSGRLAKHKDSSGRTGLDIALAILPKIVNPLAGAASWPEKPTKVEEFKVKSTSKSAQMLAYSLSPELRSDDSQSGTVELDTRLTTLFARDALGKEKWKITLKAAVTSNVRYLRYAVRYNQARCARQGQLTVAWIGDQVCAIDGLTKTGKPLWTKTCFVVNPLDPNSSQFRANIRPQILVHQDAQRLPLLVTSSFVCFQQGRKLLAVDPIDGSTLWWRDDVGSNCDLFGDADFVFARKQGQATATVLRGLDGKKLGTRPVPEISDRVVALGRQCVWATLDGEQYKVTATDLWSQTILWQRSLPKNSHLHVVNSNELALLQPDGQFEIVQTADGNPVASSKLAPVDSLKSLIVQRRLDRFVVIVNEPPKKKNAIRIGQQPVPNQHAVHGEVYILSNDGKQVAQTRIEDHSIKLNQAEGLPFVIFFHRYQNQKVLPNGGRTSNRPKTKVALIDVRSGNKVYESDREFGYDSDYRLVIDPAKKQIELTTRSDGLRVSYAEP